MNSVVGPDMSQEQRLCEICSEVDWANLAGKGQPTRCEHRQVMKIQKSIEQLQNSTCPMCQSITCIKPTDWDKVICSVYAMRLTTITGGDDLLPDNPYLKEGTALYIMPSVPADWGAMPAFPYERRYGFLSILGSKTSTLDVCPRKIVDNSIDFDIFKHLIDHCRREHTSSCGSHDSRNIPGLCVIDCQTKLVIDAPHRCQYLALSYVWGSPTSLDNPTFPSSCRR